MTQLEQQDIDVDALMRQIRSEIASRAPYAPGHDQWASGSHRPGVVYGDASLPERVALPRLPESAGIIARKPAYAISDFLDYHDEDFVCNAYRGLLGREPDAEGASRFLAKLRSGLLAKVEILGRLRFSPEGRAGAVPVSGLLIPFGLRTLRRIPVLGHVLGIFQYVLRLPGIVRNLERLESVVFLHRMEMRHGINAIEGEIEVALQRIQEVTADHINVTVATIAEGLASKVERPEMKMLAQGKADLAQFNALAEKSRAVERELRALVEALDQRVAEHPPRAVVIEAIAAATAAKADAGRVDASLAVVGKQLLNYRQNLLEQERRLGILLEEASKRLPAPLDAKQLDAMEDEQRHLYDGFYVSFEETFRGTRKDIKQRVEIYLPYIRAVGAGTATAPVLDIGCGRGEWLELLQENGLKALGVDMNRITTADCRARGLEVTEADGLNHLRGLPENSLGAVTAFHMIEHVRFGQMILLFDEVRRVLKPGGVAIFETPNPENLIVGACSFYNDPTHQRPLPPEPMQFVLNNRGFTRVEILRLHPRTDIPPPIEEADGLRAEIIERLYGHRDYALIGYRS